MLCQLCDMTVELSDSIIYNGVITREAQGEQIYEWEYDKRLMFIHLSQYIIQLIAERNNLLCQLFTVSIDRHLIEPNVPIHVLGHLGDVTISRIGYAIIAKESFNRLIAKNKSRHIYYFIIR